MLRQELFYPHLQVDIGAYQFSQGVAVKLSSNKAQSYDWGKVWFTDPYQQAVAFTGTEEVTVRMGYGDSLVDVFYGTLVSGYSGKDDKNGMLFKDRMLLLERTIITDTFMSCTPQDMIQSGLARAGITGYQLSDTVYPIKAQVPVVQKNMVQMLQQINKVWGINVSGGFIRGIFYWGVTPVQEAVYEFVYGNNIISLEREEGMWKLLTVSMPLQHSQRIRVIHPKVTGEFALERVQFDTKENGFIRTTLFFKEG